MSHTEGNDLIAYAKSLFDKADINADLLQMKFILHNGKPCIKIGNMIYTKSSLKQLFDGTD